MKCKKCGAEMITKTAVNKAKCILQFLIEDIHFCFSCDVRKERKEWLKQILEKPSGPSCDACCRRGEDECLHERFGDLEFGSDNCFTPGERQLSVRMDCSMSGDAHPWDKDFKMPVTHKRMGCHDITSHNR